MFVPSSGKQYLERKLKAMKEFFQKILAWKYGKIALWSAAGVVVVAVGLVIALSVTSPKTNDGPNSARQASLSITISQSSLKLTSIESVMPSSHLILCRPLLLLPPNPPSITLFQ